MPVWTQYLLVSVVIGLLSGILGGMFGFGGSSVSTPMLHLLLPGLDPLHAVGTPLPVAVPTAIAGVVGYYKRGLVRTRLAGFTILGALPGVVLGASLTAYISGHWLLLLTGFALLGIGVRSALSAREDTGAVPVRAVSADVIAVLIGLPSGLFAGVLANGGGPVIVPLYLTFLGLSMLEAVATSLAVVVVLSIPGSAIHWYLGHVNPQLALFLTIGVIPASILGSRVARRLGDKRLKRVFGWAMLLFGLYFIYRELS